MCSVRSPPVRAVWGSFLCRVSFVRPCGRISGRVEERPAKVFRASGEAMGKERRYRQSLLGFPYAHEGLGNRHTAAASRKQAVCRGDTCRMAPVPDGRTRRHTVPSENPYEILYCNRVAYGQVARKVRHTPLRFFIEIFVMDTVPPLLTSRQEPV